MMRLSDQYEIINKFRKNIPVDVTRLAEALKVGVHYAYLQNDISGMLEHDQKTDNYIITVNAEDAVTRQRFTIAHELGHYMLHRHLIGDGVDDDRAYRSTNAGRYHNTSIGPRQETEANRFAANVLMPLDEINRIQEVERVNATVALARRFGVSDHAMSIRLGIPY